VNAGPLPLEQFAEVTARFDAGEDRQALLSELRLNREEFRAGQEHWLGEIGRQVLRNKFKLHRQYASAYHTYYDTSLRRKEQSQSAGGSGLAPLSPTQEPMVPVLQQPAGVTESVSVHLPSAGLVVPCLAPGASSSEHAAGVSSTVTLSIEQMAFIAAELQLYPSRSEGIYAANGIDADSYVALVSHWNEKLQADPKQHAHFVQLLEYYRAILRK